MAKLSIEMGSRGTVMNETLTAIDVEEFTKSLMSRVLVVGAGGREHAIVRALARSPQRRSCCARPATPGSPPTRAARRLRRGRPGDRRGRAARMPATSSSSAPRLPWSMGSSTRSRRAGSRRSGPAPRAARLEGSKVHAKALMAEAGVPTAGHTVLRAATEALGRLSGASYPVVLKADGLAAGKGVIICASEAEAREAVEALLRRAALRRYQGGAGGAPRRRGALAAGALRRRERRPARAGPGLQADLRRRARARTPAAWAATRRWRAGTPSASRRSSTRPPAGRRADGAGAARPFTACSTPA